MKRKILAGRFGALLLSITVLGGACGALEDIPLEGKATPVVVAEHSAALEAAQWRPVTQLTTPQQTCTVWGCYQLPKLADTNNVFTFAYNDAAAYLQRVPGDPPRKFYILVVEGEARYRFATYANGVWMSDPYTSLSLPNNPYDIVWEPSGVDYYRMYVSSGWTYSGKVKIWEWR